MRFSLSSSALSSRLLSLSRVINNKNSLPILSCFLFQVKDNVLTITASDSENVMKTTIELTEHDGDGEFAVQSQTILDAVKELPEQPLTLNVNLDEHVIYLTYQNGSYHFPVQSAEEYPREQEMGENASKFALDAQVLSSAISRSLFAAAQDELRPVMNGIYINLAPGALTFVGTDAHKLVKYESETANEVTASFILPKKPANLLKSVLLKEDDAIEMSFDSKNALFKLKSHTLVCRLIEGNYPNYNAVIPANNPNKVLVDRVELVNGIKRVAVCSNPTTNLIRMDIGDNRINLTAQDIDFSVSANETISCSYDGEEITIGFKSTFLVEILSNMDTPTVVVELADSTRAGVFKPVYDDKQTSSTLMLLMPMMINA